MKTLKILGFIFSPLLLEGTILLIFFLKNCLTESLIIILVITGVTLVIINFVIVVIKIT